VPFWRNQAQNGSCTPSQVSSATGERRSAGVQHRQPRIEKGPAETHAFDPRPKIADSFFLPQRKTSTSSLWMMPVTVLLREIFGLWTVRCSVFLRDNRTGRQKGLSNFGEVPSPFAAEEWCSPTRKSDDLERCAFDEFVAGRPGLSNFMPGS